MFKRGNESLWNSARKKVGSMKTKKGFSINEVAKQADVSITTVSRVLNYPDKVKKSTYEKVMRVVNDLNYESNSLDLRLARDRVKLVAIFTPTVESESLNEISRGVLEELERNDIDSFVWNANESTYTEMRTYAALQQAQVSGAVFIMSCVEDFSISKVLQQMPVVVIERKVPEEHEIDTIYVDSAQGMDRLVGHLHQLGHRHIGLLCGDITGSSASEKSNAYRKSIVDRRMEWDASRVVSSGWTRKCGYMGLKQVLAMHPETTATICLSDELATGAINYAQESGLRCPQDISIVGFDNTPSGEFNYPKLTTLSYPNYEMGQMAARSIVNRLNDWKVDPKKTVYPLNLLIRDSSGPVKEEE
jgi:DNA-binding LacI/PurR family transcriptional regulator